MIRTRAVPLMYCIAPPLFRYRAIFPRRRERINTGGTIRRSQECRASSRRISRRVFAFDPHDRLIERGQKPRAVARRERLGPAGDLASTAQLMQQIAGRKRHADGTLVEGLAVRRDDGGASLDAAARERN